MGAVIFIWVAFFMGAIIRWALGDNPSDGAKFILWIGVFIILLIIDEINTFTALILLFVFVFGYLMYLAFFK